MNTAVVVATSVGHIEYDAAIERAKTWLSWVESRPIVERGILEETDKTRTARVLLAVTETGERPAELDTLRAERLTLIPGACHVEWDGRRVPLTTGETKVLHALVRRAGVTVSFKELFGAVRPAEFQIGDGPEGYRSNVRTYIKRIRRAFTDVDATFDQIESQTGFGYRWRA